MSVSVGDSNNVDLDAILNGGEAFMQRLADFKTREAAAAKPLADLNLGQGAREALDAATRLKGEAQIMRDADMATLSVELADARARVEQWSAMTMQSAQDALDRATAAEQAANVKLKAAEESAYAAQK